MVYHCSQNDQYDYNLAQYSTPKRTKMCSDLLKYFTRLPDRTPVHTSRFFFFFCNVSMETNYRYHKISSMLIYLLSFIMTNYKTIDILSNNPTHNVNI